MTDLSPTTTLTRSHRRQMRHVQLQDIDASRIIRGISRTGERNLLRTHDRLGRD